MRAAPPSMCWSTSSASAAGTKSGIPKKKPVCVRGTQTGFFSIYFLMGKLVTGMDKTNLNSKVAIITGGGSGIGRGIAQALARLGTHVVVCGRRQHKLDETLQLISNDNGAGALAVQADVASEPDVDRLVQVTMQSFGRVDILINNAGVFEGTFLHDVEASQWDRVMATNLR